MLNLDHKKIMINSYRNHSFDPERRGESDFKHYSEVLESDLKIVGENNQKYIDKFICKLMLYYNHKSNTASAMIVGPAKFKSNTKRMNWERGAFEKFSAWRNKYIALVQRVPRATIQESLEKHQDKTSQYSKGRVKQLEARQELTKRFESFTMACGGVVTLSNERLVITHCEKPSNEVLTLIKKRGFKFSPKTKSWVRQFTGNALLSVKLLKEEMRKLFSEKK